MWTILDPGGKKLASGLMFSQRGILLIHANHQALLLQKGL